VDNEEYPVVGASLSGNPIQTATWCNAYGVASPGAYTTCLASRTDPTNDVAIQSATIMTDGGESESTGGSVIKGRLNFSTTHIVRLPHIT
jgi:hypothetical protein